MIEWNNKTKLIISDVDETIAPVYMEAKLEMVQELELLLKEGKVIFFISGQSVTNIKWRIIDKIHPLVRKNILIGHCSGCEVWGFDEKGNINEKPFCSYYQEILTESNKIQWREVIDIIVEKFKLNKYPTMPKPKFRLLTNNPQDIMYEDRGPQITFEVINGRNLNDENKKRLNEQFDFGTDDFRDPIILEAHKLLSERDIPITPRKAGTFAIDFAIRGVTKTTAVRHAMTDEYLIKQFNLNDIKAEEIEIWGDKFSITNGGTDRHICEALDHTVRAITFRKDEEDLPDNYNVVVWDGNNELEEGTLEYIKSRNKEI